MQAYLSICLSTLVRSLVVFFAQVGLMVGFNCRGDCSRSISYGVHGLDVVPFADVGNVCTYVMSHPVIYLCFSAVIIARCQIDGLGPRLSISKSDIIMAIARRTREAVVAIVVFRNMRRVLALHSTPRYGRRDLFICSILLVRWLMACHPPLPHIPCQQSWIVLSIASMECEIRSSLLI